MTGVLVAAVAILAVIEAFHLLLTFGLIGRVRTQRTSPSAASRLLGMPVPRFAVTTIDGDAITDEAVGSGAALIAFMTPNCEPCEALKADLLRSLPADVALICVNGRPDEDETIVQANELRAVAPVAIVDSRHPAVRAFAVDFYPTVISLRAGMIVGVGSTREAVTDPGRETAPA